MNKDIFEYECDMAGKKRYKDPLVIQKSLNDHLGNENFNSIIQTCQLKIRDDVPEADRPALEKRVDDAFEKIITLSQKVFNLQSINEDTGEGLTQARMLNVFVQYIVWMNEQKKNTEISPNSTPPIQASPSTY